jgi:hypothetical protein
MTVVEKDRHIHGMLQEELERCRGMVISLKKELSNLPKGSVHRRERRYKKKKYIYHYLKYRQSGKSISKHISQKELEGVIQKLQDRKGFEKELNLYMARMKYLKKILKIG